MQKNFHYYFVASTDITNLGKRAGGGTTYLTSIYGSCDAFRIITRLGIIILAGGWQWGFTYPVSRERS